MYGVMRPGSMHESFSLFVEHKVISDREGEKLLQMVGFRNVLTHGSTKINYEKVVAILRNRSRDIEKFIRSLPR